MNFIYIYIYIYVVIIIIIIIIIIIRTFITFPMQPEEKLPKLECHYNGTLIHFTDACVQKTASILLLVSFTQKKIGEDA